MNLTKIALIAIVLPLSSVHAALIAGWNFNDNNLTVDTGAGTLSTTGLPSAAYLSLGSSLNLFGSDVSGNALTYLATSSNNSASVTLQVSTVGLGAPVLTYATGSLLTGFTGIQWAYSTDGVGYTNFGSSLSIPTISSVLDLSLMTVHTVDLSGLGGALGNQGSVFLRGTLTGNSSLVGANLVLDNIQISAVPEPSAFAAVAALVTLGFACFNRHSRNTPRAD